MSNPWTPGPWVVPIGGTEIIITTAEHDEHIATIAGLGDKAEANARLIVAAPEMAEALEMLVDFAKNAPAQDYNEDRVLSWLGFVTSRVDDILARIRGDAP